MSASPFSVCNTRVLGQTRQLKPFCGLRDIAQKHRTTSFTSPRPWWPVGLNYEGDTEMTSVFAAAGVAAAFAASLTVFVAPIDGARANPPTGNVIVVNPATDPALIRSVDDPERIAYQSTANCVPKQTTCLFDFPVVPKNHRLVVQHVSAHVGYVSQSSGAQVVLEGGPNDAFSTFVAPPSFLGQGLFDQPVLQYIDAGSAAHLITFADVGVNSILGSATISGYLLDCQTTPCAAIAP
jgi:hypothetical protein